jgi:sarcosine oxidase, subunit delta
MTCPINGPRLISEFSYAGEVRPMPDPRLADDEQWADYVFNRNGVSGVKHEWWCHTPSGVWFIAERDTVADVIIRTYLYTAPGAAS